MVIIIVLILLEVLTILVLKEHFYRSSRPAFYISLLIHVLLSIWYIIISTGFYKGYFDTPRNVWMHLNLTGMLCAVGLPRFLLCLLHYTGRLLRIRKGGYLKWLTRTVLGISAFIFSVMTLGTFFGKFNYKTEQVTIHIKGLDKRLDSLRIVQISDLHLGGYYKHRGKIVKVIDEVNSLNPDLIINTGDFISYGCREFDYYDTILSKARSRFGNFAILGNHDMGTYYPGSTEDYRKFIASKVDELATASGYNVLRDENVFLNINNVKVALIGVETSGKHRHIIHGDLNKASEGTDTADFKILLTHDPNQWRKDVVGKTNINLTLSGHTHGMQIGIITKKYRWSPAKYFYPEWNGLYSEGGQYLYVNRGLGVMGVPFRIWMPPEITLIILRAE
jgi:predicted MPP superfamily phosphohydrolase